LLATLELEKSFILKPLVKDCRMKFWDLFKSPIAKEQKTLSRLHDKIAPLFPPTLDGEEDLQIKIACVAGLLARVAYVDFDVDPSEREQMATLLQEAGHLNEDEAIAIVAIALDEIKDMAGLENHKYCHPLNDLLNQDERYDLLVALFAIAASDGEISDLESEEIRLISQGLNLEHHHFVTARAVFREYLGFLKDKGDR
jgi:uncharacterized tellurite resistance protein B-like protein